MHTAASLRRAARSLGLVTVGVLSTLGALSLTHVGPASAQTPGVNLAALVAQVNALQSKLTMDETTISSLQSTVKSQGDTINSQGKTISTQSSQIGVLQQDNAGFKTKLATDEGNIATNTSNITGLQTSLSSVQSKQTTDEGNIATNTTNIGSLQTLTKPLSLSGTDFTFTGVNVHIVDGTSSTSSTSGLGNLIIGYNAMGNNQGSGDVRTGSHNLILGDFNNYASYGGLIAGYDNSISGEYAVISGGFKNMVSGPYASISGGDEDTASNYYASVSGGHSNTASSFHASVSGGNDLTQNNQFGWTGGGYHSP